MSDIKYKWFEEYKKEFSKLRHKRFWLTVVSLIIVSGIVAIANDGKPDSAWREMAAGAFSGGIIGLIVLWYEQLRENEREKAQILRDIEQAERLQIKSDNATNIRSLADKLLNEVIYIYENTFEEDPRHDSIAITFGEMLSGDFLQDEVNKCSILVSRINDRQLTDKWDNFAKPLLKLLAEGVEQKNKTQKPDIYGNIIVNLKRKKAEKRAIDISLKWFQQYLEQQL